jgi:hypothetical protein
MAIFVFTNGFVSINGVDLSNHGSKVTTNDTRAQLDITAFGASALTYTKGLGDASISVDFFQDFAAASVHATLSPLISTSTPFAVEVRPVNSARSATNPAFFLAAALLFTYPGMDGSVGQPLGGTYIFQNAGQAGMTYPIS